ncbi:unnamed protein product [Mucor hiemalis]
MQNVAKKYDVVKLIQFNTTVVRATWLDDKKKWELELNQVGQAENQIKHFDFIFSGIGALRVPNIPQQFESFQGKIIHSAYWDHDYDLNNKRVAVIGSGTSAIQIVPGILDRVEHLYSYQRTPTWVAPKDQYAYSDLVKFIFAYIPFAMLFYRAYLFLIRDLNFSQWSDANSKRAKLARGALTMHMTHIMKSRGREDLVPKLIPDFPVGCKRIGTSDDYIQALCSPKVTVNCTAIDKVQGKTLTTVDGNETEVDTLILATGFNVTGFLGKLQLYGRDGLHLNTLWEEDTAKTYKTVSVHGFPNFFVMLGPGSGLGHSSVVTIVESQVNYGIEMVRYMIKNNITSLEPTEKAQEAFSSDLQSRFKGTVWKAGCKSWYMNKSGDIQSLWPQTVMKFMSMLKGTDYESDFIRH